MQVDRPGKGSGEPLGSPHSPPKTRRLVSTDKKKPLKRLVRLFIGLSNPARHLAATSCNFNAPQKARQVEILLFCVKNAINSPCRVK